MQPIGPCPARVMVIGEYPGDQELHSGVPFSGSGGQELTRMLNEAGIMRGSCFMTNVLPFKPFGNDLEPYVALKKNAITSQHVPVFDRMVLPAVRDAISRLSREIEMCRPNVIICLGNLAMFAVTGEWGITSWRGSMLPCALPLALDYKPATLSTFSPNWLFGQWQLRPVMLHDLRRAKGMADEGREVIPPNYRFVIKPSFEQAQFQLCKLLETAIESETPLKLAVDIETRAGHISCVGIAWSELDALCIPLMVVGRPEGYWPIEHEAELVFMMHQLLKHPNVEVIGQNFHYDEQYLSRQLFLNPNLVRDTMLGQHSCFSNMQKGLDFLSSMYCKYHRYWKDDGKEWNASIPEEQHWTYNCTDAVITWEVDTVIQQNVDAMGLREVHDFQMSLYQPVLRTMERGLRVDKALRAKFAMELIEEIAKREQWLIDMTGMAVNIKSPKQMQDLFYTVMGQKPIISKKTRGVTTDDEALRTIGEREPLLQPVCKKISELRSLNVFLSTFVNAPLDIDGRIRCSFNIAGTETYRFSSRQNAFGSGLNLQNIPKGGDDGEGLELPNVRNLFIPDPGFTFFDIDLDSADLRIVAWEAELSEMKAMLAEGKKVYVEVMKEFYHNPSMTKDAPEYRIFKSLCHGTHYLGKAAGLSSRLGLGVHEIDKIQKWYYGKFPGLKKWQDHVCEQVTKRRMVENIFGNRMYFFDRIEGTIFNQAIAWIPQSTVGLLINRAYVAIDRELPDVQILLQVHDSLAGQYPTHLGDYMRDQIVEKSKIVLPYSDPLIIPVGVKTSRSSWGDCG